MKKNKYSKGCKSVVDILNKHKRFLITSHIDPEGDALGSQLALGKLLERKGKLVNIVNERKAPDSYNFLPGVKNITLKPTGNFEVAVFLDSAEASRVGKVVDFIDFENKITLNIDHHISNTNFADLNWVDPNSSSCGEMVYRLFKELNEKLDAESALNLYTAIFVDTGSFRYSNTKPRTHRIAAELLNYDIKPEKIYENVYDTNTAGEIKLLGLVLSQLRLSGGNTPKGTGKICSVKITREMLSRFKLELKKTDDFTNFARSIVGVEVAILFRELKKGEIKVSFRSRGKVDVNKLAQIFDGGGHQAASGCRIKGSLEKVEKMVIAEAREILKCKK